MSNFLLRFVGSLSLAYVGVKVVTAYYLFMFAPNGLAAALANLPALSRWDALILLFAAVALAWAVRADELTTGAKAAFGPVAVSAGLEDVADSVRKAGAPQQATDALRTDLRNLSARCRDELVGQSDVDFETLFSDIDHLRTRLLGTELEPQLAPLHTQVQRCAAAADNIAQADRNAMRLRDNGLDERAHRLEGEALEMRMGLLRDRERMLIAADVILRTTGPLLDRHRNR